MWYFKLRNSILLPTVTGFSAKMFQLTSGQKTDKIWQKNQKITANSFNNLNSSHGCVAVVMKHTESKTRTLFTLVKMTVYAWI